MRSGCDVICEKPLVLNPWNLDQLLRIEEQTGKRVHPVLQLRYSDKLQQLREKVATLDGLEVRLQYVTRRGPWYHGSWKGDEARSGGILSNIGVHLFDLILWLFGDSLRYSGLHIAPDRAHGQISTARAVIHWELSVNGDDLPSSARREGLSSWRFLQIADVGSLMLERFGDLHRRVYDAVVRGHGLRIADARPSIGAIAAIRRSYHDEMLRLASA